MGPSDVGRPRAGRDADARARATERGRTASSRRPAPRPAPRHGLTVVAGFVPAVLHDASGSTELHAIRADAQTIADLGGEVLVLAASSGRSGYESADRLDADGWRALADGVARAAELAQGLGLRLAVHPHRGTVIERPEEVDRLLDRTDVGLCLDTGHVAVGGGDPLELARRAAARDPRPPEGRGRRAGGRVVAGELGYRNAVRGGSTGRSATATRRDRDRARARGGRVRRLVRTRKRRGVGPGAPGGIEDVRRSLAFLERAWEEVGAARES